MLRKSFKYRCYPNGMTKKMSYRAMRIMGDVWSNATSERSRAYFIFADTLAEKIKTKQEETNRQLNKKEVEKIRKNVSKICQKVSFYSQYRLIKKKDHPQYADYDAQSLTEVLRNVDSSFKSFYALRKNGDPDAMPPNQKRMHWAISYRQSGWRLEGNILYLKGIGKFRIRLHRQIIGKIKLVTITEKNRKWYVSFSCEIDNFNGVCGPMPAEKPCIGSDLRQEHISSGGSDPEKGSAHNHKHEFVTNILGGSDPEKGSAHNPGCSSPRTVRGGSDPEKGSAHNASLALQFLDSGGSDPKKGSAHNKRSCSSGVISGGSDPKKGGMVEIGFGFKNNIFIIDSDGFLVEHPEFYFNEIDELKRLSLNLSRKEHHSKNWNKAKYTLSKWHERITNKRDYFLWHLARFYAENYKQVTIQKWPLSREIQYATNNKTARKLCDGAYGKFIHMLKHKCNELNTEFIERKELTWQREIERLTEQAKMEKLTRILRESKKAVKRDCRARFRSLEMACERLMTLRI